MPVTAELRRKNSAGDAVDYVLVDDAANLQTALSDPTVDFGVRARLDSVLIALQDVVAGLHAVLTVTGTVTVANPTAGPETGLAKDATLATVAAAVDGLEAQLVALQTELAQKLEPGGSVSVTGTVPVSGPLTDAQLRAIAVPVAVSNQVPAVETGLAKETTLATVYSKLVDIYAAVDGLEITAGNIEISSETINLQTNEVEALLQVIRDRIPAALDLDGGSKVHVQNFPATQPVSGPLTDVQLRAGPVPVSGTVTANLGTIDGAATETTLAAILTELGQKYEGGPVALDVATLAALESITVTVANPTASPETGLAKEVTLASILAELGQKYEGGPIALDAATLAALESVTVANPGLTDAQLRAAPVPVSVANPTADPEIGLAKDATLGSVLAAVDAVETKLDALLVELGQKLEPGGAVAVSGTVTANLGTIDGAATEVTLADANAKLGGDLVIREHPLVPKGFEQITTIATASALTVPAGALYAMVQADTPVRYRDDGTDPTGLVGIRLPADGTIFYTGSLIALRIIGVAVGATVNISYYGRT